MSTWLKNIQWNDSVVSGMTESPTTTAAPTTASPRTIPPPPPPVTNPNYPTTTRYGDGNVVFPLPVSPDLLLGSGNLDALNPVTTTAAPTLEPITNPPTLAPVPPMTMMPIKVEEDKPFWTKTRIAMAVGSAVAILGLIYFFFLRNRGGNSNKASNKSAVNNSGSRGNTASGSRNTGIGNTLGTINTGNIGGGNSGSKNAGNNKASNTMSFNNLFKNISINNKPTKS